MPLSLNDRVAVVTGASRGVGRRMVARLAATGARVAFGARRSEPVAALERELKAQGHDIIGIATDVARHDDCGRLVRTAIDRWGRLDVLVNCAGVSGPTKLITEIEPDEFADVMRANCYGIYSMIHFAAPAMMAQGSGSIVNIGSMTGKRPMAMRTPYSTSKMALVGLTRTVAVELAPHGVRCNTISPGPIAGERVEEVLTNASRAQQRSVEELREMFLRWSPQHEMVTEEEICEMVMFLCSDAAKHMTGQDINMTGGIVMY